MSLRALGIFERALFLSDQHAPFHVIGVLRLNSPPTPSIIQRAIQVLQKRHPLLGAVIKAGKFERRPDESFSFQIIEERDLRWLDIVEREMNSRLHPEQELFRGIYLYQANHADLFLTFHHTIMDATSGMNIFDELLRLCVALQEGTELNFPTLTVLPSVEDSFPYSFKGVRGAAKMMRYTSMQMVEEIQYQGRVHGKRKQTLQLGGRGFPLTLILPESLVDQLSKVCRAEKVTLNSLLNASLVLATNRHLYAGAQRPLQTFTFADLRPYTVPPTSAEHLGNYISMMRFTVEVSGKSNIWELTQELHEKIYRALKRGDKFLASKLSESLIKMFIRLKSMRMGATGLNYSSAVPLQMKYGEIKVRGLHAFLSSFDLGPEVSSQARLFNNELWMDFMFLETDMDRKTAEAIVGEVKSILEETASGYA